MIGAGMNFIIGQLSDRNLSSKWHDQHSNYQLLRVLNNICVLHEASLQTFPKSLKPQKEENTTQHFTSEVVAKQHT